MQKVLVPAVLVGIGRPSTPAAVGAGLLGAVRAQWRVLVEHRNFRHLFGGDSISLLGSSVTSVALPLTAVLVLGASSVQMGLLGAASFLPHLVLGLPAGVWVGRLSYRRVIVGADLLAAAALATVPILAATGLLQMWQLYVVVVITGTCSLFSTIASQSFAPLLVPRRELLAANSAFALSNSVVATSGSAIGGVLVQLLTAPVAIAVDAASFLLSAISKARISVTGRSTAAGPANESIFKDIWGGVRAALEHPALRATTIAATVGALAGQMQAVVVVLFLVRELSLSAGLVGLVIALAGAAGIVGAAVGVQITGRLGNGPAFIVGMMLSSLAGLVMAAAGGPMAVVLAVLVIAQLLRGWGPTLYGINQQTIRQTLVAPELLARTQATWRFLVHGMQPIGALLGGTLGALVGFRATLATSSLVMMTGTAFALLSPLRTLRQLPDTETSKQIRQ
ncbi:MFS transporter [Kribbella shirazensis]|uniref:Na+/melibiose symporter-like transporter n=1 Tax=Kribbella shirazensis TaxID=1105143 RepID=A0A7X5V6U8_9ACTN|nr:MFS transporter [Kribbella shirazensis]NIK55721.1 Na+/melibiose symporter-like transporter [Kribbella shirazensis]